MSLGEHSQAHGGSQGARNQRCGPILMAGEAHEVALDAAMIPTVIRVDAALGEAQEAAPICLILGSLE